VRMSPSGPSCPATRMVTDAADSVPRRVPTSHTGMPARLRNQAIAVLMSSALGGLAEPGRVLPVGWRVDDRRDQALLGENPRVRTRKLFALHLNDPSTSMCRPPRPPANRMTAARAFGGVRTSARWVTPGRFGMSTTFCSTCASAGATKSTENRTAGDRTTTLTVPWLSSRMLARRSGPRRTPVCRRSWRSSKARGPSFGDDAPGAAPHGGVRQREGPLYAGTRAANC